LIRICFILGSHWEYRFGGSEYQVKLLIDELKKKKGVRIFYLYSGEGHRIFKKDGITYCVMPRRTKQHRMGKLFLFDTCALIRRLKKIKPDVIYQRVASAYTGVAAYYSRKNNCRSIWHIASEEDVIPLERRFRPSLFLNLTDKKFLEYGIKNMDCIIGQAEYQDKLLQKYYGRKCDFIVPNFHPSPRQEISKPSRIQVVWTANFKSFKRPELFVKLAEKFRYREDVDFIMIGRPYGKRKIQKKIEGSIRMVKNLNYVGEQALEQTNRIIKDSHILINTSRHEGFPNTFIQAWMRKVPVVSLNVDPDNVLEKKRIGFHSKTFERLVKDLDGLLKNKRLREQMGMRARQYALEVHALEKNRDRVVEILIG